MNEVVRTCALPYLEDDNPEVRRAAALTCCVLFLNDPICYHVSNHAIEVIGDVLGKLLTVGIADPGLHLPLLSFIFSRLIKRCRPYHPADRLVLAA